MKTFLAGCVALALLLLVVFCPRHPEPQPSPRHEVKNAPPVAQNSSPLESPLPTVSGAVSGKPMPSPKLPYASGSASGSGFNDTPESQAKRADYILKAVDFYMAMRAAEYAKLWDKLGLSAADRKSMQEKIAQLYEIKVRASTGKPEGRGAFAAAQAVFDGEVKTVLGENYAAYRTFEEATPVRSEAQAYRAYTEVTGREFRVDELAQVEALIQRFGLYPVTHGEWGGPYQNLPPVPGIKEVLLRHTKEWLIDLQQKSAALLRQAEQEGVSPTTIAGLQAHYASQEADLRYHYQEVKDPYGMQLARAIAALAKLEASPTPVDERTLKRARSSVTFLTQKAKDNPPLPDP